MAVVPRDPVPRRILAKDLPHRAGPGPSLRGLGLGDDSISDLEHHCSSFRLVRLGAYRLLDRPWTVRGRARRGGLHRRRIAIFARGKTWTLALEKVPAEIRQDARCQPLDRAMQSFLGETVPGIVRDIGADAERYRETQVPDFISAVEESGVLRHVFDEIRGAPGQTREYRYVDYPLPLGESIMLNHALAASALHAESAPVTDEPFHRTMLQYKLGQARGEVAAALHERARERGFANSIAAAQALRDPELGLPAFAPDVPLQAVIDYRLEHPEELEQVRRQLSHMTRAIRTKPWTPEFVEEVEHVLLPQLGLALEDARARRDAWLRGHRGRRVLTTIGLAAGTASTVLGSR